MIRLVIPLLITLPGCSLDFEGVHRVPMAIDRTVDPVHPYEHCVTNECWCILAAEGGQAHDCLVACQHRCADKHGRPEWMVRRGVY